LQAVEARLASTCLPARQGEARRTKTL